MPTKKPAKKAPAKPKATTPTPLETALVLRTCNADLTSHGEFRWPESGTVEAPDWQPTKECGNGLHGWLHGEGDGILGNWSPDAKWLVVSVEVATIVDLGGKVKFPRGEVVHCGDRKSATEYLAVNGCAGRKIIGGTATAGYRGTATAGVSGTATAGYRGTATAGYGGTATAGDRGTATAGDSGTATAGDDGVISVLWWDDSARRHRRAIGVIGEGGLEANVAYRLDGKGKWEKAPVKSKA